jgi:hypothetical protein
LKQQSRNRTGGVIGEERIGNYCPRTNQFEFGFGRTEPAQFPIRSAAALSPGNATASLDSAAWAVIFLARRLLGVIRPLVRRGQLTFWFDERVIAPSTVARSDGATVSGLNEVDYNAVNSAGNPSRFALRVKEARQFDPARPAFPSASEPAWFSQKLRPTHEVHAARAPDALSSIAAVSATKRLRSWGQSSRECLPLIAMRPNLPRAAAI